MNHLQGKIESINENGSLSLVKIRVNDIVLSSVIIDTPETLPYLKTGATINAVFKETEVLVAPGKECAISLQNRIPGKVATLEKGKLLSRLSIESSVGLINSIITTNAVDELSLSEGSEVVAMIKTNEVMLSE